LPIAAAGNGQYSIFAQVPFTIVYSGIGTFMSSYSHSKLFGVMQLLPLLQGVVNIFTTWPIVESCSYLLSLCVAAALLWKFRYFNGALYTKWEIDGTVEAGSGSSES